MAFTFSYNDYFKNNANAQIPSSSTVPKTSSTVPTTPVLYSQFVSPPTYTPPSLTTTPAPNPTPTPTPSTGYGAVTGQYGTTTPTSAGKGTGGSTITYSSGLGGDVTGGSEGGGLKIQRVSEVLTGSNGVTGEYSIGGVIGSTTRKAWERIKELLDGDGTPTIEISEDGYLVIDGVKTEYQVPGKNGADGNGGNDETGNDETGGGNGNGNNDDLRKYYEFLYNTGLANAEQAKQQALLNAQTQYKEFINPYGTVANQQAALGLQNGGYSEYLQGQAYQGMLNTQNQARSDYSKTQQSLYSDYMGNMAKYNQEQQNKADAVAAAKADLLNNIGNYTSEEALGAALDALGITDAAERQSIIDQWKTAKAEKDIQEAGQKVVNMEAALSGLVEGIDPNNWDSIYNYGKREGLSEEELATYKTKWDTAQYKQSLENSSDWQEEDWNAFFANEMFNSLDKETQTQAQNAYSASLDPSTIFGGEKPFAENNAQSVLNEITNSNKYSQAFKDAVKAKFDELYGGEEVQKAKDELEKDVPADANVVDINSPSFTSADFGKFNDTGKEGSGQESYLASIIAATKISPEEGGIKEGQVVIVNYGKNKGKIDAYIYVGDGKFVAVDVPGKNGTFGNIAAFDIYVPKGYRIGKEVNTPDRNARNPYNLYGADGIWKE